MGDGGSGLFLRLKDGESAVGIFRGEVYEYFQIWEAGKSHVVSEDHPGAKSRFRLNFLPKGESKPKIFEFGLTIYNQLAGISEDYEVDKTAVKITRRGTGTDTIYMIVPLPPKEQPTAAQLKSLDKVELNILEHKDTTKTAAPSVYVKNYAPGAEEDELGF